MFFKIPWYMLNVIINTDYFFYWIYSNQVDNPLCISVKGCLYWVSSGRPQKDYPYQLNGQEASIPELEFWITKKERKIMSFCFLAVGAVLTTA